MFNEALKVVDVFHLFFECCSTSLHNITAAIGASLETAVLCRSFYERDAHYLRT